MGRSEAQQRQFVMFGRPAAFAVAFVGFGAGALLSDSEALDRFLVVLAVALIVTQVPAWVALARGARPDLVARAVLLSDIVMVAALTAALDTESLLAVAFFAPIAFSALMFGSRFTLLLTALAIAAVLVVAFVFVEPDGITLLADLIVLAVTGGILAALSTEVHATQGQLERDRASDAAALSVAERIGFPRRLEDVLAPTVEELGRATGATRCIVRLRPAPDGTAPVYEWDRPGSEPAGPPRPPPNIREIFESGEPLVVGDAHRADPAMREWADSIGARAIVGWPVTWRGEVTAVLGFTDTRTREWEVDGLPLIRRVAPLVGAALGQVEAFDELQRVNELRAELVARVSHELRTPLTSTIGFLQTLERTDIELEEEERERYLSIARAEAERLARLVDDLLELARLERGHTRLDIRTVDLGKLAQHAATGLEIPAGRMVAVEVPAGRTVQADPDRLNQILTNLITNGLRHGEGSVVVTSAVDDGQVEIAVTDDGPGIPEEQVGDVFQPFARGGGGSIGTGLGLAIARALAEAHGGTLEYRPPQNGSPHAFVLSLPAVADSGP
jgi:signal transduction histidine kinase